MSSSVRPPSRLGCSGASRTPAACATTGRSQKAVTPADAADCQALVPGYELDGLAVREIVQARQDLSTRLGFEPREVLVVALDEDGGTRNASPFGEPAREITSALVAAGGVVNSLRIRPDPKVADMKDPVELHAESVFERQHVGVEPIERSVYVAGRANNMTPT